MQTSRQKVIHLNLSEIKRTNTLTAFGIVREGADGIILKCPNATGTGLQNVSLF